MTSKIRVLDELIANQIAAGEVIERPASVVKELVENSIDAGSSRIQVEVIDGGRTSIRILDNGEGISKVDVVTAFERHATSKIHDASDLFAIRTLGFRGEALGSIASISKVNIRTRIQDEPTGTQLKIEGSEIKDQRDVGMAVGTDFVVEDLFYNTPARYKYMKTVNTEMGQISDLFNRIAVAEPQISMSLAHNGRLINRTPGTGRLLDTLLSLYGRELVEDLVEVDYEDSYIKVWGYATKPTTYRSSRKHQSFYVNGRYVRSNLLSRGVRDAYANLLPQNRHPIVFLFIKINAIHVDVNVHPAKMEIKFSRPEMVVDVVTKGIRQALLDEEYLPVFRPMEKVKGEKEEIELTSLFGDDGQGLEETEDNKFDADTDAGIDASTYRADASTDASIGILSDKDNLSASEGSDAEKVRYIQEQPTGSRLHERLANLNYEKKNWDPQHRSYSEDERYQRAKGKSQRSSGQTSYQQGTTQQKMYEKVAQYSENLVSAETGSSSLNKNPQEKQNSRPPELIPEISGTSEVLQKQTTSKKAGTFIANLLPIGQIHNTYIIAQGKDGFYVFDQHVVHERILYEELMDTFRKKGLPSQTLLIPITLELTFKEIQAIENSEDLFQQMGFEVEHFGGNTVIVRSAPKRMDERPDKDLFLEILDLILEESNKAGDRAQLYDKLITSMSCKGAIKAGEHLEQGEMIQLLKKLSQTENPRFCPHGRPILFHITEKDLLKAFQRI